MKLAYTTLLGALALLAAPISGCDAVPPADPMEQIIAEENSAIETDDAECRERCARHAREVFQQCKARGGTDEQCRVRAREALRQCLERCRPSCRERCRQLARTTYDQCKARGGSDEQCRMRAAEVLRRCLTRCDRPDGGPRPDGGRPRMSVADEPAEL
jgi:hypothetical protein